MTKRLALYDAAHVVHVACINETHRVIIDTQGCAHLVDHLPGHIATVMAAKLAARIPLNGCEAMIERLRAPVSQHSGRPQVSVHSLALAEQIAALTDLRRKRRDETAVPALPYLTRIRRQFDATLSTAINNIVAGDPSLRNTYERRHDLSPRLQLTIAGDVADVAISSDQSPRGPNGRRYRATCIKLQLPLSWYENVYRAGQAVEHGHLVVDAVQTIKATLRRKGNKLYLRWEHEARPRRPRTVAS